MGQKRRTRKGEKEEPEKEKRRTRKGWGTPLVWVGEPGEPYSSLGWGTLSMINRNKMICKNDFALRIFEKNYKRKTFRFLLDDL